MSLDSPVLIIGATSDIGRAIALGYAQIGSQLILAGRDHEKLLREAADLRARGHDVLQVALIDLLKQTDYAKFFDGLDAVPATIILTAGLLERHAGAHSDPASIRRTIETNYLGPALFLAAAADKLEEKGGGCIIAISSVAGDRGRASNYVYGSAKAGLSAFLSGLRNRLSPHNIRVITVKPGFVTTRMTQGMRAPFGMASEPAVVAKAVLAADRGGRDEIYAPGIWRLVMTVICLIPEKLFKRMTF